MLGDGEDTVIKTYIDRANFFRLELVRKSFRVYFWKWLVYLGFSLIIDVYIDNRKEEFKEGSEVFERTSR